jgi:4-hydroxy-tetrahydrodipicolinate synthase
MAHRALEGIVAAPFLPMQPDCSTREIWPRLGPLARYCWRPPIRDDRPRMKDVLALQGLIRHAAVTLPQLPVGDGERLELERLAAQAGLIDGARRRTAAG